MRKPGLFLFFTLSKSRGVGADTTISIALQAFGQTKVLESLDSMGIPFTEVVLNKGSDGLFEYAVGLRRYVMDNALN